MTAWRTGKRKWRPTQLDMIQCVKEYPIIYKRNTVMFESQYTTALKKAWIEISSKTRMRPEKCKELWKNIKSKYVKLNILIQTGKVAEDIVYCHPETSKFFDGNLSFMNPYLSETTDAHIPSGVHKLINNYFNLEGSHVQNKRDHNNIVTDEQEDDNGIEEHILPNSETSVLNRNVGSSNVTRDISNTNNETKHDGNTLGLQSELIIEDHIKTESDDEDDAMEDTVLQGNNMDDIAYVIEEHNISPDSQTSGVAKQITIVAGDTINETLVVIEDNTSNVTTIDKNVLTGVSDNDMRRFFYELGEVLDLEMSLDKQRILQKRINDLLTQL